MRKPRSAGGGGGGVSSPEALTQIRVFEILLLLLAKLRLKFWPVS